MAFVYSCIKSPCYLGQTESVHELICAKPSALTAVSTARYFIGPPSMHLDLYTYGDMTSRNLWSRYVRHFVGITWRNVWS